MVSCCEVSLTSGSEKHVKPESCSRSTLTHPGECTDNRNDDQDIRKDTRDDNSGVVDGMVNQYIDDLEDEPTRSRE